MIFKIASSFMLLFSILLLGGGGGPFMIRNVSAAATTTATTTTMIQPQADLTQEELEILDRIQNPHRRHNDKINNSNNNDDDDDDGEDTYQKQQNVHQHQNAITSTILKSIQTEIDTLQSYDTKINHIQQDRHVIQERYESLLSEAETLVLNDVVDFNLRQLDRLNDRIVESKNEELERRSLEPEIRNINVDVDIDTEDDDEEEGLENDEEDLIANKSNTNDQEDMTKKITKKELQQMLSIDVLMTYSEMDLYNFIDQSLTKHIETQIIPKQFTSFEKLMKQKEYELNQAMTYVNQTLTDAKLVQKQQKQKQMMQNKNKCVNNIHALNMVQSSVWMLDNDDGIYDHLSNGASVVHGDGWTSDSYTQSLMGEYTDDDDDDDDNDQKKVTLGDYQQYMPEDWERLLPEEWKDVDITYLRQLLINDPRQHIPVSLWHSLPLPLKTLISPPGSASSMISKPPETITSKNNNLGSCWAMAGTSGQITLRMHHPITVNSITIDHYPGLSSAHGHDDDDAHDDDDDDSKSSSAPKLIRVVGYPSCKDEDKDTLDCIKLGFDKSQPMKLGSFEYKPVPPVESTYQDETYPRRSTQNFVLAMGSGHDVHEDDFGEDEDEGGGLDDNAEEEVSGGSCSAIKPSCGNENNGDENDNNLNPVEPLEEPIVAAISIIVDENWGHEDYTCIYRVRVHGE